VRTALRNLRKSKKRMRTRTRAFWPREATPDTLNSTAQRAYDALFGRERMAPLKRCCVYCGGLVVPGTLEYEHGPSGCLLRSDEENIGAVVHAALEALEGRYMAKEDALQTEIKATGSQGGAVEFRCEAHPHGHRNQTPELPRCWVRVNDVEVELDPRIFQGWARNALNCLGDDY